MRDILRQSYGAGEEPDSLSLEVLTVPEGVLLLLLLLLFFIYLFIYVIVVAVAVVVVVVVVFVFVVVAVAVKVSTIPSIRLSLNGYELQYIRQTDRQTVS